MKTIYYAEVDQSGKVAQTGMVVCPSIEGLAPFFEGKLIELPTPIQNPDDFFFNGHSLVKKPESPGGHFAYNYGTNQWEKDVPSAWAAIRARRDSELNATDWVITKYKEASSPVPEDWLVYRQSLRDISKQDDPFNIVWPVRPRS